MLDVRWEQGSALLERVPRNLCPMVFQKLNRLRPLNSAYKGTKTPWSHLLHICILQAVKRKTATQAVQKRCAAKEHNVTNHVRKQFQAHLVCVHACMIEGVNYQLSHGLLACRVLGHLCTQRRHNFTHRRRTARMLHIIVSSGESSPCQKVCGPPGNLGIKVDEYVDNRRSKLIRSLKHMHTKSHTPPKTSKKRSPNKKLEPHK